MAVDLTPDPHVADLAARTAAFVRAVVVPEEERSGGVAPCGDVRRQTCSRRRARPASSPPTSRRVRRPRARHARPGAWSSRRPAGRCSARSRSTSPRPTRATCTCSRRSRPPSRRSGTCEPLAAGAVRSCFAMTEPAPGAGSDPAALSTTATPTAGGWLINGRKWFITGADGAAFTICMARTSGDPGDRGGATMFLVDADTPGCGSRRHIDTLDEGFFGGHCELELRRRLRRARRRCSARSTRASSTPRSGSAPRG